jgi:hypothetical protein
MKGSPHDLVPDLLAAERDDRSRGEPIWMDSQPSNRSCRRVTSYLV